VRGEDAFKFCRRDLEALVLDQLLDAIGDVKVAIGVLVADVAGLEVSIVCERISSALGVVVVSLEDIRTLDPKLTDLARGNLLIIRADVFGRLVGQESANRASVPRAACGLWVKSR
jgi:hypothetical protein